MIDHAKLLRQIQKEARPYVEQMLDLKEVFSGFQKLASDNGLDWGAVKALLKAQVEDERAEDGTKRVDKIIEKADFATAYADMLGLGSANMNENNSFEEADLPSHDSDTGEITEPEPSPPPPPAIFEPHDPDTGELPDLPAFLDRRARAA